MVRGGEEMSGRSVDPASAVGESQSNEEEGSLIWPLPEGGPFGGRFIAIGQWLRSLAGILGRELDAGRGFLWVPVAFGVGILVYFALPNEPSLVAVALLALGPALLAWRSRRHVVLARTLMIAAAVVTGVGVAKLRTDLVASPVVPREMTTGVTGWVAHRDTADRNGARVLLRVHGIERLAEARTPRAVRITIRSKAAQLSVGDAIAVTARLSPPSGPLIPGGYDYARAAFYDRFGAIGFAYGGAKPVDIGPAPFDIRVYRPLAILREAIRLRVVEVLPGEAGHIAAALIMGDQGGISDETQESMRASGLGHVFSISGLHMVLVAGTAFWLIRALLALSPTLALTRPIKKWAAAGGLLVAAFYLGLSGAEVATQRAFIMLAIMFVAVLLDRRAITLRNVALAALVILISSPESILSASFQMSFAATIALVAAYEAISLRADRRLSLVNVVSTGVGHRVRQWVSAMFLTSLVAGLATTPFGIYHFQRLAPLAVLANLAAMPVVGLLIMPMALAAVALMPFGLDQFALVPMQWGINWMLLVSDQVASWSEGIGGLAIASAPGLLFVTAGFLWLTLWREKWRLAGIAPMLIGVAFAFATTAPDVVVDGNAKAVAVRGVDRHYRILSGRDARFEVENWLRYDADTRLPDAPDLTEGVRCDSLGCTARTGDAEIVALVEQREAFDEDCRLADVVISRLKAPDACANVAIVIDGSRLRRFGAHALYRHEATPGGLRIETAYPAIRRPFMPPVD
jgi:competence protein ComEC